MSRRSGERRFLTDRMLGTLTRYLRFMGYDTL
ncbi:MAG TPA: Mut7-C RNAse domain-containing protein, partial [Methanoculleus sp.]|nr:Mut7-C RNAse domain-containing protein [Methanoculleus sp.]HPD51455.1 Mut7-C RNAse domain-containing protein [Methanoculleus sp.]